MIPKASVSDVLTRSQRFSLVRIESGATAGDVEGRAGWPSRHWSRLWVEAYLWARSRPAVVA